MKKPLFLLGLISTLISNHGTLAQTAYQPLPNSVIDIDHSGLATGSAVQVLNNGSANPGYRVNCILQNNGTTNMYYLFGGAAATGASRVLAPGVTITCSNGSIVSTGALSLLGGTGQHYALTEEFLGTQQ